MCARAWSNGADLKSAVFALVGSNPTTCNIKFVILNCLRGPMDRASDF